MRRASIPITAAGPLPHLARVATHLALLTLCLCSPHLGAAVRTFVDPKVLDETETLRLTLRLDGAQRASPPDLQPLEKDFEVLGSTSSSQYRSINGQVQAWIEYQINLRPLRTGSLTIPALAFAGEYSDPTVIEVRSLDPVLRQEIDRMVFFETQVSPDPVYVQAEIKVVRRLFYATNGGVQMYSELPGTPAIADAVVISLSNAESQRRRRNGIDYNVVEQRFAVYPERSGRITIPAVSLTSSVRVLKQGRTRRSGVRVSSQAHHITVLPIPAQYPDDEPWLPATAVELSQSINPRSGIETGTPITRILRAQVTGNVSSAISPLSAQGTADDTLANGSFRAYPQAPEMSDVARDSGNVGTRQERSSLLPLRPGSVAIPEQTLTWWDTRSETVRVARADAIQLTVSGQAIDKDTPAQDSPEPRSERTAEQPEQNADSLVTPVEPLRHWPIALLLALLVALAPWLQRLRKQHWPRRVLARLLPFTPKPRGGHSIKKLRARLATQLEANPGSSPARRGALLASIAAARDCSTADAAKLLSNSAETAELMRTLDRQCYGDAGLATDLADAALLAAFDACLPERNQRPRAALPPLYPRRN